MTAAVEADNKSVKQMHSMQERAHIMKMSKCWECYRRHLAMKHQITKWQMFFYNAY